MEFAVKEKDILGRAIVQNCKLWRVTIMQIRVKPPQSFLFYFWKEKRTQGRRRKNKEATKLPKNMRHFARKEQNMPQFTQLK
jgi:hypothetical protein